LEINPMKKWLIAPIAITVIAIIAAACGGDETADVNDALIAEVAVLRADLSRTQEIASEALLRASLPALELARFHDIDERINDEARVEATDPGFLARAQQVLDSDIWPAALQPNVDQFRDAVAAALPFVRDNDPAAAGRPILIAHANAHEFQEAVAAYFDGEDIPPPPDLGQGVEPDDNADEHNDDE